jgi:hypothetical protein
VQEEEFSRDLVQFSPFVMYSFPDEYKASPLEDSPRGLCIDMEFHFHACRYNMLVTTSEHECQRAEQL